MTAKEYLGQAYRIDQRINSKLEQIASLRALIYKVTTTLSDTPKGTSDSSSRESIIAKMMDLETEINNDIDKLVELKHNIMDLINKVDNPELHIVLEERYLCFKTWEQIAVDMGYSLRNIYMLHASALKKIPMAETLQ